MITSHKMLPQSLFLSIFFTFISSPLCSSRSYHDEPLANFLQRTPDYYDLSSYPSYLDTIDKEKDDDDLGSPATSMGEVSVENFRSEGVGQTDDTEAFKKAWEETCSSDTAVLVVPKDKKYHVKPITFSGPCKSDSVTFKILGTIEASDNPADYASDRSHWLLFRNIHNFIVEGDQGTIDGNGKIWWDNSCKTNKAKPCTKAPTAVSFVQCDNLKLYGLKVVNSQEMHVSIEQSVNVEAVDIIATSPATSPDTNGIHVTSSENVHIIGPVIQTGDDCITIVDGSKNVRAKGVTCGPGHGISVGILEGGSTGALVSNVLVYGGTLTGTTFGVRIKTWQGVSGNVDNIVFEHVKMESVSNPIIIDQNYCDQESSTASPCKEQESSVQIRNVIYKHFTGTSATKTTSIFNCSKTFPCQGLMLRDINVEYKA